MLLAIESSCDDTACAILGDEGRVRSSVVSSQLAAHRPYGGVVPEIASREHLANWPPVLAEALAASGVELSEVEAVAATKGPGLLGSLLVGLSLGKALAYGLGTPFFGIHHLEGHLYSPFLDPEHGGWPPERFTGLVVSGGHTSLYAVEAERVTTLAETRDDAMGEVFDKVGKRAGLAYPQGPKVDLLAEGGDADAFELPVPRIDDLSFSYSGLKSAALRHLERLERGGVRAADGEVPAAVVDLLAAFRRAAVAQLVDRLERVAARRELGVLAVSGGVAANRLLRRALTDWCGERGVELRLVSLAFAGDNAAMIGYAAALRRRRGEPGDALTVEAASRVPLGLSTSG